MGDKITKLSQAIRLGATFRPQCRHHYFEINFKIRAITSCTLGAAYEAITGKTPVNDSNEVTKVLEKRFPEAIGTVLGMQITKWNDYDQLTREEIADRLEKKGL